MFYGFKEYILPTRVFKTVRSITLRKQRKRPIQTIIKAFGNLFYSQKKSINFKKKYTMFFRAIWHWVRIAIYFGQTIIEIEQLQKRLIIVIFKRWSMTWFLAYFWVFKFFSYEEFWKFIVGNCFLPIFFKLLKKIFWMTFKQFITGWILRVFRRCS